MSWADISTAPRDGTRILLWCGKAMFGCWSHRVHTDNGKVVYDRADWVVERVDLFPDGTGKPTLWMPEPAAPEAIKAAPAHPERDSYHTILIHELRAVDPENPRLHFVEEALRG